MPTFRTDHNTTFDGRGNVVSDTVVQVDITDQVVRADIVAKARQALTANATFLALGSPSNAQVLAQTRLLTREVNGLIRLLGSVLPELFDLLAENADT